MRARSIALAVTIASSFAWAAPPAMVGPSGPIVAPWVTTSCWVEHRWFETLRNGPVDYCKRSLRYHPGKIDCIAFADELCWMVNRETGEYQQFRHPTVDTLIQCPQGPEPPTCSRLR